MIADELGIDREITTSKVRDIKPLSHRMEVFLEKDEVRWIDDGKSTSSQAQRAALASMEDKKTILIAGGKDKGDEFEGIEDLWKQKCKHIFLLGEMADKLSRKSSKCQIPSTKCGSLKEMVRLTRDIAQSGDTILFSPGCSSLDMFENWKVRAEQFRDSVLSVDEQ